MSFFKDLKEDIAQSVSELTESLDENLGVVDEKEASAGKLENLTTDFPNESPAEDAVMDEVKEEPIQYQDDLLLDVPADEVEEVLEEPGEPEDIDVVDLDAEAMVAPEPVITETAPAEDEVPAEIVEEEPEVIVENEEEKVEEDNIVSEEMKEEMVEEVNTVNPVQEAPVDEVDDDNQEVTVITKGTTINGGIKSDTSLVVKGTIEGDVECQGKLTITGKVAGNTIASEIYVNTPRLEGDINSRGIVKIDVGTVVIGNVNCTSVLVAGAVKGDIEVNGPVIVDSTAVVKGDIKAKSIQINSGAVIDGHCSLAYADVDLDSFFE
ncbi:MAG: polymer-forming cytoskeletal protein [Eubacterium sp.]|nr:polymer-forming cytoskeletal protein [Eubacterium sp.]